MRQSVFQLSQRRLVVALAALMCCIQPVFSQSESANAIYFNNGDRVIGYVLQLDPAGDIKLQTTDGNTVSYPMSDVNDINWSYQIKYPSPGKIYRMGDIFKWKYNNLELTDRNFDRYFDADLYHTYIKGRNQLNLGGGCFTLSIGCLLLGILETDLITGELKDSFYAYVAGAAVLSCFGFVFTRSGKNRLDWVEKTFNEQQDRYNESLSSGTINNIKLSPSLLLSSQNDLALGASLSLSF